MILTSDEKSKIKDSTNAMGKTFVLTALNTKGEDALRTIYAQKDTEREKVIMTKGEIKAACNYAIYYKFTNAAQLLARDKRLESKFKPFTVANVISRLMDGLKAEDASLMDVEIEVLNDEDETKKAEDARRKTHTSRPSGQPRRINHKKKKGKTTKK